MKFLCLKYLSCSCTLKHIYYVYEWHSSIFFLHSRVHWWRMADRLLARQNPDIKDLQRKNVNIHDRKSRSHVNASMFMFYGIPIFPLDVHRFLFPDFCIESAYIYVGWTLWIWFCCAQRPPPVRFLLWWPKYINPPKHQDDVSGLNRQNLMTEYNFWRVQGCVSIPSIFWKIIRQWRRSRHSHLPHGREQGT